MSLPNEPQSESLRRICDAADREEPICEDCGAYGEIVLLECVDGECLCAECREARTACLFCGEPGTPRPHGEIVCAECHDDEREPAVCPPVLEATLRAIARYDAGDADLRERGERGVR